MKYFDISLLYKYIESRSKLVRPAESAVLFYYLAHIAYNLWTNI